jgi:hypothetical protein
MAKYMLVSGGKVNIYKYDDGCLKVCKLDKLAISGLSEATIENIEIINTGCRRYVSKVELDETEVLNIQYGVSDNKKQYTYQSIQDTQWTRLTLEFSAQLSSAERKIIDNWVDSL